MAGIKISELPPATLPLVGTEEMELEDAGGDSVRASVDDILASTGPLAATYVTVTPNAILPNERILTAGSNIGVADGGAGAAITVSLDDPVLLSAGTVGAPSYSFAANPITGIFNPATDVLGFAVGGLLPAQVDGSNGAGNLQFVVAPGGSQNNATFPSFAFGDGDSGIFESVDDQLALTLATVQRWFWSGNVYGSLVGGGAAMRNVAVSATVPTVHGNRGDLDSGLGQSVLDAFTGIAGGVTAIDYREASSRIIQTNANHVGLTASVTQTQVGGLALLSSYNEVATVANTGDALTAFGAAVGDRLIVINNGASDLQLFPDVGDDIGAGVDAAITIAADDIGIFIGRDATNWDTLFNGSASGILDPLILNHLAVGDDEFAVQINTDGAGFADVKSIDINHTTGVMVSGTDEAIILIDIDEILASGGDISALEVLATEGGADKITGLFVGAGIGPIEQLSGAFVDADTILNIAVDVTVALSSGGAGNISVFVADNDTMTIGLSTTFQEIETILDTPSSGAGIDPLFEFSTGVGAWTTFTPTDGTNGMRNTGVIAWELGDIPTWAPGTGGEFLIRITRERNVLSTTPIIDLMRVVSAAEYSWAEDGDVTIPNLSIVEKAAADPDVAGEGQFWVRNDVPNTPMFTDDAGTDFELNVGTANVAQFKFKTANESKTSDTALADDADLNGFVLEADTLYAIEGYLTYTQDGGDIKLQFQASQIAQRSFITFIAQNQGSDQAVASASESTLNSVSLTTLTDAVSATMRIDGLIHANAITGGTLDFQWAQNTSDPDATTIFDGAWIRLTRVGAY